MRRKKTSRQKLLTWAEKMRKLRRAGIGSQPRAELTDDDQLLSIEVRIEKILGITTEKNKNLMIYFVMYDIENNKVRNQISKFLIRKGCHRVQKSIFLANTPHHVCLLYTSPSPRD